jgi:hypothetical protein
MSRGQEYEDAMKILQLKPEDFPLTVLLHAAGGPKEYVLVKTKQDKLLLNRPVDAAVVKK